MDKKTMKKVIKTIIEWILYIVIFFLIVFGTPELLTRVLHSDHPIASITSSSMWPTIKKGDMVFIRGVSGKNDVSLGDIVVYKNERGFTIHRITKLTDETFVTRGDANNVDDQPVEYKELVGKAVIFHNHPLRIPYLGLLSQIFKKPG